MAVSVPQKWWRCRHCVAAAATFVKRLTKPAAPPPAVVPDGSAELAAEGGSLRSASFYIIIKTI
jgi:hypothetical protein